MHLRPANWPLVVAGIMGIGIGGVGLLVELASTSTLDSAPIGSCAIAGIGIVSMLLGWFYDPSE